MQGEGDSMAWFKKARSQVPIDRKRDLDYPAGEYKKPTRRNLMLTEVGKSGLKWSYGQILEEFFIDLRGKRGIAVYREMSDNDPIVGGCLLAIRQILKEVRWSVRSANSEAKELDADGLFLEDCMRSMTHTWSEFIAESMSQFIYGWASFEQVYKRRDDGKVVWKKLPLRAQSSLERWDIDDVGDMIGMWQRPPLEGRTVYIPIKKLIHFRTDPWANNPEGRSLLRNCYRPWYFRKNMEEIEGIGVERDVNGLPVMDLPEGLKMDDDSPETRAVLDWAKKIVTNVRVDEQDGILQPHGWKLSLLSAPGAKQFDTTAIINRYSKEIAISLLAQFVMLGMERTGSYALSKDIMDLFHLSLEGWADSIASTFNRQAVSTLFSLNGVKDRPLPYIVHTQVRKQALKDMSGYVKVLVDADALDVDEEIKSFLRKYGRLTEYSEIRK